MVMVFSLKSSTAPISCNICLPMMRSYKGAVAPASYSTMSGVTWIDYCWYVFLRSLSDKKEVTTRSCVKQYPLIVLCLTISLSLVSLTLLLWSPWCFKDLIRCFFFKFSLLFGLFSNFPRLTFRELQIFPPQTLSIANMAVTFPVLEFSIAISLALIVSSASLVALIGRLSVDFKWMPEGCINLIRFSTGLPVLLDPLS